MGSAGHHLEPGVREPSLPSGPMAVARPLIGRAIRQQRLASNRPEIHPFRRLICVGQRNDHQPGQVWVGCSESEGTPTTSRPSDDTTGVRIPLGTKRRSRLAVSSRPGSKRSTPSGRHTTIDIGSFTAKTVLRGTPAAQSETKPQRSQRRRRCGPIEHRRKPKPLGAALDEGRTPTCRYGSLLDMDHHSLCMFRGSRTLSWVVHVWERAGL